VAGDSICMFYGESVLVVICI